MVGGVGKTLTLRRPRPQRVNWLVSSTTCLKTSSPTKNLTRQATNYDSKNPPSVNSKGRPLLWATHCCQPPNSPVHIFKFLRSGGGSGAADFGQELNPLRPVGWSKRKKRIGNIRG